jgi:hypothetical protein
MSVQKVSDAMITDLSASKLSGTIADARFPATLPAISGANLTGIDALPAVGSSGNVLTSDGTNWASTAAAGGGAWNLIGTAVASGSSSLTITGLDSTYDTYAIAISDVIMSGNGDSLYFRVGDSNGVDSGAGDYQYHAMKCRSGSDLFDGQGDSNANRIQFPSSIGNATGECVGAMLFLHNPGDGSGFPNISGTCNAIRDNGDSVNGSISGHRTAVITLDRVSILPSAGTINGRMTVWGIAHS